jgi:hypothetical protein
LIIATRRTNLHKEWPPRLASVLVIAYLGFAAILAYAGESGAVTYTQDFPGSDPEHYSILLKPDGGGAYECVGKISQDSEDSESYQATFQFSEATRRKILDLAAQTEYFSGKIDSGNKKVAFTGTKKLAYKDGVRDFTAEYNYSSLPAVQQLTSLFQNISATLEFGRRLVHLHRYQKLALDEELKTMEAQAHKGDLAELQSVKPILQQIYDDPGVINIVRSRALRIMDMGNNIVGR